MSEFQVLGEKSPEATKMYRQLKEEIEELRQENQDLNIVINGLTDNIKQNAPYVEQGVSLRVKVKTLSKKSLHLASIIFILQDQNNKLKEEKQVLSQEVAALTETLQANAPLMEEGRSLQGKVKSLSRSSLHLASLTLHFKDKLQQTTPQPRDRCEDNTDEGKQRGTEQEELKQSLELMTKMKESINEELDISRQLQSEMQTRIAAYTDRIAELEAKVELLKNEENTNLNELSLKLKKSEEKSGDYEKKKQLFKINQKQLQASIHDYDLRLDQKNKQIEDLKRNVEQLTSQNKLLGKYKEQLRIATDWKLTEKYVQKINENFAIQYQVDLPALQKRIKELEEEHRHYDYLFENERNVVETQRKLLERKQTELVLLQSQLSQKQLQLKETLATREKMFQKRQESLQEEYINKFKSLKDFNSCQQCTQSKVKYQQVINQLRKQLEKTAIEKERISYQHSQTLKNQGEGTTTLEQLLEKEMRKGINQTTKKEGIRKELQNRHQEMMGLIDRKLTDIQKSLEEKE